MKKMNGINEMYSSNSQGTIDNLLPEKQQFNANNKQELVYAMWKQEANNTYEYALFDKKGEQHEFIGYSFGFKKASELTQAIQQDIERFKTTVNEKAPRQTIYFKNKVPHMIAGQKRASEEKQNHQAIPKRMYEKILDRLEQYQPVN